MMDVEVDKSVILETSNNMIMLQEPVSNFRETSSDITMLDETLPTNSPSDSYRFSPSSSEAEEEDDYADESSSSEDDPYDNPYICEECDMEFITYESLEVHKCIKQYGCPICAKPFDTIGKLVVHTKIHFPPKSYNCQRSNPKRFRPDYDLKSNGFNHVSDEKPYSTEEKPFHVPDVKPYTTTEEEMKEKPFACTICGKRFKHKCKLTGHVKTHSEIYKCVECNKTFSTKHNLKRHSKDVHGVDDYKFELIILPGGKPNELQEGQKHSDDVNSHNTDIKPYVCGVCGKSFASKIGLKRHIKIHSKEHVEGLNGDVDMYSETYDRVLQDQLPEDIDSDSPPKIVITGEQSANVDDLKSQTMTHNSGKSDDSKPRHIVKPYKCNYCGKCFASKQYRKKHLKMHTNEPSDGLHEIMISTEGNPKENDVDSNTEILRELDPKCSIVTRCKCEYCGKYFSTIDALKKHSLIHMEEHGKDAFVAIDLLSEMLSIIEGKTRYKCEECGKDFATKQSIKRHSRTHTKYPCKNSNTIDIMKFEIKSSTGGKPNGQAEDSTCSEKACDLNSFSSAPLPFRCDCCSKSFATYHGLKRHQVIHVEYSKDITVVKSLISEMIGIIEGKATTLNPVSIDRTHKCEECGKYFTSNKGLKQHLKIHLREQMKRLQNDDDTKLEMSPTEGKDSGVESQNHQSVKPGDLSVQYKSTKPSDSVVKNTVLKPFKCDLCGKRFAIKQYLKKHSKVHAKANSGVLDANVNMKLEAVVPTEGKSYDSTEIDNDLNFPDSVISPYKCDRCGRCFTGSDTLKIHSEEHTTEEVEDLITEMISIAEVKSNEREGQSSTQTHNKSDDSDPSSYKCEHCEKCFATSEALKIHDIIHIEGTEERSECINDVETLISDIITDEDEPNVCNSAESSNDVPSDNTETKSTTCLECGKSFHTSFGLSRHAVIHRGVAPFTCEVCGKSFPQLSRLTRHVKSHEKLHKCEECGKCFGENYTLKRHLKLHSES